MGMASQHHLVIFPFMAQGHTLPLLDLSKAFSRQGIKVTIITTPSNAPSIKTYVNNHSHVHLKELTFPSVQGLPKGCENTADLPSMEFLVSFLYATKALQLPFHHVLQDMSDSGCLPLCVISDFFLGWTLDICRSFGIPRLVFHGMSVLSMAISKTVWMHKPHLTVASVSDPLHLPGLNLPFTLTTADLPDSLRTPHQDDPFSKYVSEAGQADAESWGIVVNSFVELEQPHVTSLESFYTNGAKAWFLGPLLLYNDTNNINSKRTPDCIKWLTEQALPASVIYVSFGTQADVSDAQLDEVAWGLEMSGYPFLWVVRSTTWCPPNGMEDRVSDRGLIVKDWVDQRRILGHRSTGGFLSHCGWNSVLESLSVGVPILAWPMMAEQTLNAKLVVDGFGAGIRLPVDTGLAPQDRGLIRKEICEGVMELMDGKHASDVKERAQALGRAATRAVQEGGSSYETLSELLHKLCAAQT
nr:glycosyltransferase [Helleborus thibetanus]